MVLGTLADSLTLLIPGVLLSVAMGATLKPELRKERYAGAISLGWQRLLSLGEHLRLRGPVALAGGFGGIVIGGLMLGWWWDLGLPVQCQDLGFPDPPLCSYLFFIRAWFGQSLILAGVFLGWVSRRPSDWAESSTTRVVFEVLGQLVALAAVVIGAIIIAPIAWDLPGYRQRPWLTLAVGSVAISGGLLYTIGLRRTSGRRAVVERAIGWMMFTGVLLIPLLVSTYLVRWWLSGVLLSAFALPAIWRWERIHFGKESHSHRTDPHLSETTDRGF